MADALDNVYSAPVPPDQQKTAVKAAAAAAQKTSDTFVIERSGLNVVANGVYAFSFAYTYSDPENPSNTLLSLPSANFRFTLEAPDYTVPVQNLTVTPGTLSYIAKWDPIDKSLASNKWFIDAQIYESTTGAFAGEEYLVWNGTGNTATILVGDLNNRWIRVDTRDQDYHKKSVLYGPFKATDPIIVDTTGPGNVTGVTTSGGIDTSGYMGFNGYATISWPAVTGNGIRGYRIRFSNDNNATYSYVDSPGTGTTYKLGGLAVGATYKIAVATYDEYNNTSSSYVSGSDVTISGVPAITNYITAGPFQFGVGVGSVSTNKGLYFDASNYWLVNATNSARLKVGGSASNYLEWNGTKLAIDGDITARGGSFSGNILMTTNGASIYSGTVNSSGNLTGDGFALNSSGLKVTKGSSSITLDAATGQITANAGSIAGWTLSGTTLSKNNVVLDSTGKIQVGATANASVYIQSAAGTSPTKTYVMWAGNNVPDSNAKFKVGADGVLYATGAVFGTGTTVPGYATSGELTTTNTNVTAASTAATNAYNKAVAAQTDATAAATKAQQASDAAALKVAAADVASAINNNITKIEGAKIVTGSIELSTLKVVGNTTNGLYIDNNGIRGYSGGTNTFNLNTSGGLSLTGTVYSTAGQIGGFDLSNADLTASTSKLPRILFGNKILIGYDGGPYTLNAGNPRGDSGASFYVNTNTNVFRFAADSASRSYAAEIRNDIRARDFRYIAGGGLVNDTSSRRFKENITYAPKSYYDRVLDINPAFYTYKHNHPETEESVWGQHGFGPIVEDLEDAGLGMFVQRNLSGQPTSLKNEHKIPMLLIPIVRELKEKVSAMEQKILELESK